MTKSYICLAAAVLLSGAGISREAFAEPPLVLDSTTRHPIELSPQGVSLDVARYRDGRFVWEPRCVAPCREFLETGRTYRIRGDGVVTSASFKLDERTTRIEAYTSSVARRNWGVVVGGAGAIAALSGLWMTRIEGAENFDSMRSREDVHSINEAGTAIMAGGICAMVVGFTLFFTNMTTTVSLRPASAGRPVGSGVGAHTGWPLAMYF